MMATINSRVRKLIRLSTTEFSDTQIKDHIQDAEFYVERDVEATLTIADYDNATTGSNYYDILMSYRAAWTIYVEWFQSTVVTKDPTSPGSGIEIVYEQQYLINLANEFPLKVEYRGGGYRYARPSATEAINVPYPDTYLMDNRPDLAGLRGDRSISEI